MNWTQIQSRVNLAGRTIALDLNSNLHSLSLSVQMYVYIYIDTSISIYIITYVEAIYIYICIYMYTYTFWSLSLSLSLSIYISFKVHVAARVYLQGTWAMWNMFLSIHVTQGNAWCLRACSTLRPHARELAKHLGGPDSPGCLAQPSRSGCLEPLAALDLAALPALALVPLAQTAVAALALVPLPGSALVPLAPSRWISDTLAARWPRPPSAQPPPYPLKILTKLWKLKTMLYYTCWLCSKTQVWIQANSNLQVWIGHKNQNRFRLSKVKLQNRFRLAVLKLGSLNLPWISWTVRYVLPSCSTQAAVPAWRAFNFNSFRASPSRFWPFWYTSW